MVWVTTVRVASAIAMCSWRELKWTPATRPSWRASETSVARRPLREVIDVCRRPEAVSSLTMFDTVAGERPVLPASST